MQTPLGVKNTHMNHLCWCLKRLKYREGNDNEELFDYIYRYIYHTISEMENMEPIEAIQYYRQRIDDKTRAILLQFNIELSV